MKLASAYIEDEKHAKFKTVAKEHNRTMADHLRMLIDEAIKARFKPRKKSKP